MSARDGKSTRRVFVMGALQTALAWSVVNASASQLQSTPTRMILSDHPRIRALAAQITADAKTPREAAVAIHGWVRDQIAFGIAPAFYAMNAVEVLDAGVGYCNTKTTLFSALLRAAGIATRTRMLDLSAEVLRGLFDPGTPYVDHSITEVSLDRTWLKVDSYVVDLRLEAAARLRLQREGARIGYGIHSQGSTRWDGMSDSLIQGLADEQTPGYVLKDHGIFNDVEDFYARTAQARNRRTLLSGLMIRAGVFFVNRQIEAVRNTGS